MALNLAPFGRWTLHDKAVQRRLALRYASGVIMRMLSVVLVLCSSFLTNSVLAADPGAKALVERGLSAYLTGGPDAAIKADRKSVV